MVYTDVEMPIRVAHRGGDFLSRIQAGFMSLPVAAQDSTLISVAH